MFHVFKPTTAGIRTLHRSASSRWIGAQTDDSDRDWRKPLKRVTTGAFCFG